MPGFFEYRVRCWTDGKPYLEEGVTYAENFTEAVQHIEDYYGEDFDRFTISALEPYSVYVLKGPTKVEGLFDEE